MALICSTIPLAFSSVGRTNELWGHVSDRATATVIAGAKVQVWKDGQPTDYKTATDFEGNFSIQRIPPGSYDVVIFHPSCEKREIRDVKILDGIVTGFYYGDLVMEPTQTGLGETKVARQKKMNIPSNQSDTLISPIPLPSGFYLDSTHSSQSKSGRQVRGQVLEKRTKEPIFYARVRLLFSDGNSAKLGTTTDIKGNFLVSNVPPGAYQVEISYGRNYNKMLIKNIKVEADNISEIGIIYLEEKADPGDTVIVPNHRGEFPRKPLLK